MSAAEESTRLLIHSLHAQLQWKTGTPNQIQGMIHNVQGTPRQIFIGEGTGWTVNQTMITGTTKNTNAIQKVTHLQITKSQKFWTWQKWLALSKKEENIPSSQPWRAGNIVM